MTKIILAFLSAISLLSASQLPLYSGTENVSSEQRDVKTLKDLNDLIQSLKSGMQMGLADTTSYYLGTIYLTDFNLTDGSVEKNIPEAKKYFRLSLNEGNFMAAYNLSMISVYEKEYDAGLFILDQTLQKIRGGTEKEVSAKKFLALTFGSMVLQYKQKDIEATKRAIDYLDGLVGTDNPTGLFILANLYNVYGDHKRSNLILNVACSKNLINVDERLKNICKQYKTKEVSQ